jgi:hypothetical protein
MTEPEAAPPGPDRAFLAGLAALVALPLIVGTVALRRPPWSPVLDLAMTELRVRDVGTPDTPLIGLPGRIGGDGVQGSHPGPLSFWLLAPGYRLFGSTGWALHAATALLDVVAISLALVLGHRLGGRRLAVAVALALSLLIVGYGLGPLLEPWNPYVPLLWWVVFLLSIWAALLGDRPALVVAVVSGSLCAQTHVPYLSLCLGLGVLAVAVLLLDARRRPEERATTLRWVLGAAAVGAVLWVPPTIDQVTEDPGNYQLLLDHFGTPPEDPIGLRRAGTEVLEHFDLGHLVVDQVREPGLLARGELGRFPVAGRGAVLLVAWGALAAVAWRRSPPALRALHLLIGVSALLAWYSISRVFGVVWYYLMLWLWAVAALTVVALVWSATLLLAKGRGPVDPTEDRPSFRSPAVAIPLVLVAVLSLRATATAPDAEPSDNQLSRVLQELAGPTADALDAREGQATGRDGRYVVGFDDALHIGSQAYGLVTELERAGFEAGMEPAFGVPITHHRTIRPEEATARVELVTGTYLDDWRAVPGAVEVGPVDLRTPEERAELAALRTEVEAELEAEGLAELIPYLDTNLFRAAIDQRASEPLRVKMDRMLKIGLPTSVFITSSTATRP